MEIIELCEILLNTDQLYLQDIQIENDQIQLLVESTRRRACCPKCAKESTEIHSHYLRYPRDLAWAQLPVVLYLSAKRFFCSNAECPKRTFAERFPGYLEGYARKTQRVLEKQGRLGINVCARIAEKLLRFDQLEVSDTTLNRLLRALPEAETQTITVLGVDDWAKRKGQRYGTLLVDQEKERGVDVLEDRTAETLEKWLATHPEIKIVTRDRSKTYAEGIRKGAPQAVQIADRWHLLKNGSDAVQKIFQQENVVIQKRLKEAKEPQPIALPTEAKPACDEPLTSTEQNRKQRIDAAQELVQLGWTQKAAAQQLDIHPKTVRRYLASPSPKIVRSRQHKKVDPYKADLLRRWNEGCHNATQLFREIQLQGFAGSVTLVVDFARQLRQASDIPPKVRNPKGEVVLSENIPQDLPSLRTLTWWVSRPIDKRQAEDERILERISDGQPKLQTTIALARDFAELVRNQHEESLSPWMEKANQSGYRIWSNFAAGLRQDEAAVRAALSYRWSNGRTEGNVNRLKYLKRMMYGRAKDDLLRKRVLGQGYFFT